MRNILPSTPASGIRDNDMKVGILTAAVTIALISQGCSNAADSIGGGEPLRHEPAHAPLVAAHAGEQIFLFKKSSADRPKSVEDRRYAFFSILNKGKAITLEGYATKGGLVIAEPDFEIQWRSGPEIREWSNVDDTMGVYVAPPDKMVLEAGHEKTLMIDIQLSFLPAAYSELRVCIRPLTERICSAPFSAQNYLE